MALALLGVACTSDSPTANPTQSPTGPRGAPEWKKLADAPTSRLEVATAAVGDFIYVAGGLLPDGGVGKVVERYDTKANGWKKVADLPVALHHAMGVNYRGRFVVIGGFAERGFGTASRRVFALNDDTEWEELARLREPRGAGGAAVVGRRIYVFGGQSGGRLVDSAERFTGTRWRAIDAMPTPRDHLAAAADDRYVYAIGGRRAAIERTLDAVHRYDTRRERWTELPDLPTARGGMGAALVDQRIVVAGGEGSTEDAGPDGVFGEVEVYNTETERWDELPQLATPRHGVGVAAVEGVVFVAVGGPTVGSSYSTRMESLEIPELQAQ